MRAHGLGAGAVPQIMVFEILNFGFRKGAAPIGRRLADALVTHRLVQTKNPSAWVVRISFGNFVFVRILASCVGFVNRLEPAPTMVRGVAQPGRAPALGAGCRRFESSRPDHLEA